MTREPLRSAISIGPKVETSLEVPSDQHDRSAQQRVLDQVHTLKRSQSKYSHKSGQSAATPTSPGAQFDSVFYDSPSLKFTPSGYSGYSSSKGSYSTNGYSTQTFVQQSSSARGSTSQRHHSSPGKRTERLTLPSSPTMRRQGTTLQRMDVQGSRSAPDLSPMLQQHRVPNKRQSFHYGERHHSQTHINGGQALHNGAQTLGNGAFIQRTSQTKFEQTPIQQKTFESVRSNGGSQMADMTIKDAVEYLFSANENHQLCGASYIQHSTFTEEKAKGEVLRLKGIPPLVGLLGSPNPQMQLTASAALQNLVFKNNPNKEEVQKCGGITNALNLLKETDSEDTLKHLTGLLWNLSSNDSLKVEMVRSAVPVLTERVVVPYTTNTVSMDPEIFYNTTACLRNLSSGKLISRQALRNSKGLIDSLVSYVHANVAAMTPDDKSVENCVCILHNLTYQLENEMPSLFTKINALAGVPCRGGVDTQSAPIGCFSNQSNKLKESSFDYPVMEDNNPKGMAHLFHSSTLQSYLSLLGSSQRDGTLEACCGALHNLTASKGPVSNVLSQTIVKRLNGIQNISPLLQSENPSLSESAASLLTNLSRAPNLQSSMARQSLPQMLSFINSTIARGDNSPDADSVMATACQSAHTLLKAEPEMGKTLLSNSLINSLTNLSQNRFMPKSSSAASVLLYSLWSDKDFQSSLRRNGMNKKLFVNDITSSAFKALQVVD